jgi:hypothetical protein
VVGLEQSQTVTQCSNVAVTAKTNEDTAAVQRGKKSTKQHGKKTQTNKDLELELVLALETFQQLAARAKLKQMLGGDLPSLFSSSSISRSFPLLNLKTSNHFLTFFSSLNHDGKHSVLEIR